MTERSLVSMKEELLSLLLEEEEEQQPDAVAGADRKGLLPLSYPQQRAWFIDRYTDGGEAYKILSVFEIEGRLDHAALERTLNEVVRRHEVLRTTFDVVDGAPVQVIAPELRLSITVVDLQALAPGERRTAAERLAHEEARQPFDLQTGPLLRARLLALEENLHVFVLTVHHIVFDGWSVGVLVNEVAALYGAYAAGAEAGLPELPIQYADYAVWQRERLAGTVLQQQLDYWKERLQGAPALLALPTDRPRPGVQTHKGDLVQVAIPQGIASSLQRIAQQAQSTLFMTLLAAFKVLLGRYSGQDDICVGTPIANRQRSEFEALIGFFANTLVLRTRVQAELRFDQLLAQVRESTLEAYAHQDLPFEKVVECLEPDRVASHSPLFQTMFVLQNAPGSGLQLPGLSLRPLRVEQKIAKFDLTLMLFEVSDGLRGNLEYNTDLFDRATVERMMVHFTRLLEAIVDDPQTSIGALPMLDGRECEQLLLGFNDTAMAFAEAQTLHGLFEEQAHRTPAAVAAVFEDESLTYAGLDARAKQLASYLRTQGVGPGSLVAVCVERSLEMVVALLGILKAGAAYVPLDPNYPRERLAYVLEDAAPALLLTQRSLAELLDGVPTVCIDGDWDRDCAPAPVHTHAGELAYVIYTSGSTGRPKGVAVTHRNVGNFLHAMRAEPGIAAADVLLAVTPISFDIAGLELFLPLTVGATTVIAPRAAALDPAALVERLVRHEVTMMQATPATWRMLVEHGWDGGSRPLKLLCGGEALPPSLAGELLRRAPLVWNLYGPTETTIWSALAPIADAAQGTPIGRPIGNTQIYLLDAHLAPVPVGVAGELHIGGEGVARGYLKRPGLTAERFVPNPYGAPGARMYKTGDLARWRADGSIEYLGRNDFQVKLRGFRIELGEIEARLAQCAGVREAVVVAREDAPGEQRLVAYLTGTPAAAGELRAELARQLAEHMLPAAFVTLERLPLTPNGKIDRKALPAPDQMALAGRAWEAPQGEVEQAVAAIWQELLKVERIGRHDSFFALGGHSLLAVRMAAAVRSALGLELEIKDLFANATLAALANLIARGANRPARAAVVARPRTGAALPASFAQQRLWFLDRMDGSNSHYNMPAALLVKGRFDPALAGQALGRIAGRHEPLRTVFARDGEQLVQVIREQVDVGVPVVDLAHLPQAERERAARELALADAAAPFDLAHDPMLRASYVRLGEDEGMLLFNMHHIASDGWSMGLLVREFTAQYQALRDGRPDPFGPLAVTYADYAQWQRDYLAGPVLQEQLGYWEGQLAGLPPVHSLPLDRPRPPQQGFRGARHRFTLDREVHAGLKRLAQERGATLFMVLHAALSVLLARHGNSADIVIGTPVANRLQKELEEIIGFFVNTLVLRTDVSGNPRFDAFLDQVKAVNLDAQSRQDVPFEYLVERLNPARSTQYGPLFQIMFSMGMAEPRAAVAQLEDLAFGVVDNPEVVAKFDLEFDVSETAEGLVCQLDYNAGLFEAATAGRLAGNFGRLLAAIVADPSAPVHELPMLSDAEHDYLLHQLNATEVAFPQAGRCVHELFEAHAQQDPEREALVCDEQSLSYRELNERANRLAHYLVRERGVKPETLVGICIGRTLDMVVAILGVLKAGGAYVPLDPDYPAARLAYMVEDARLDTVLTHRFLVEREVVEPARALCLDDPAVLAALEACGAADIAPEAIGLAPSALAYVIYTSGSTGKPKGVMVEHANLVNLSLSLGVRRELSGATSVLQFTTINFDISVANIFGTLCNGARLVLRTDSWPQSPSEFWARCGEYKLDVVDLPTAYWHELVKDSRAEPPACVSQVIFGGEAVNRAMVTEWHRRIRNKRVSLTNIYGPTECTVETTMARLAEGVSHIGRPIENYSLYVLGPAMSLVPAGAAGELYVGGAGVARGYLNRPDLSAERFVANPFHEPGKRSSSALLYKTGDLVCYLPDGNLEFLGRADGQVKIRGFRIELGEIESQLAEHAAVGTAAVVARDVGGEKRLVAYVTPQEGHGGERLPVALKAYLKESLPEYMVPSGWVVLDALPLTPNGKVDAQALPAPDAGLWQSVYVAPRDAAEEAMARVWAKVLGLERVGIHDNFFELGGHSLLALGLVERLREAGLDTTVRALFGAPTIAGLAATLGQQAPAQEEAVPPNLIPPGCRAITPAMLPLVALEQQQIDRIAAAVPGGAPNVQDVYPLAPLQEGILFHHLLQERGDVYLLTTQLAFDGRARLDAFVAALQRVIARHDVLRTCFAWEGLPEPLQVVLREAPASIEEAALDPEDGDIAAQLRARYDPAHYRIDVRQAPLTHGCAAYDPAHGRWLLQLVQHHLVGDHVALEVMIEEIQAILAGEAAQLPPPVPFRQFVAQARHAAGLEEHAAFFRKLLGDIDAPTAPFGLADVQGDGAGVREASLRLDGEMAGRLRREASRLQVSAASVMHLAFGQVLARLTGRRDIVFGTVLFGRMRGGAHVDRVPGVFINTLPMRLSIGGEGVAASLRRAHALLVELVHHEHAPLALAQRCSGVAPSAPLFTSLMNYRHTARDQGAAAVAAWDGITRLGTEERTNYPVSLAVDDFGDDFLLTAQVAAQVDPERLCAYMQTALAQLLDALEAAPQTPCAALEVLPADEREQLLVAWNRTAHAYEREQTLHGLFEAQARRTPAAVAAVFEGESLTYAGLDARSNRLAAYLRDQGVGAESLVAVCLERSLEMVVALLGILKAGAAYVPLDPNYPRERLAYVLEDAAPALLLTQRSLAELLDGVPTVCIDGDWDRDCAPAPVHTHAGELAYVIYTSGSTGRPKGVAVTHRNVGNFLHAMRAQPGIAADDVLLAVTPISFDIAGLELFLPLTVGATTVIAPRAAALDPAALVERLVRHEVTMMQATPATWRMLVEHGWDGGSRPLKLLCGGEALPPSLAGELLRRAPLVWNLYGPTETTIWSALAPIADAAQGTPIGRPIGNTQIYLLDAHLAPVPVGVAGELHIGGEGVARGYLKRPGLTAERFVPNPYGAPGARMYKTGDLARWRADGSIEYLGRNDFQVKLRGFRIELGEIEARLTQCAGVREAVVVAHEDAPGEQRLVAYLTVAADAAGELRAEELVARTKEELGTRLPAYMVPSGWMVLERLPLTPNGKVDRKALPAPDTQLVQARYSAPETDTEATLAELWRGLLGVERVGVHDNFFDLGGNSLSLVKLHGLLMEIFQKNVSVVDLFRYSTVQKLAAALDSELTPGVPADIESRDRAHSRRQAMQRRSGGRVKQR